MAKDTQAQAPQDLSADDILEIDDIEVSEVIVPEWNNARIRIKALSMDELMKARRSAIRKVKHPVSKVETEELDDVALSQALFLRGVISPVFTPEQVERMFLKKGSAVLKVVKALNDLNGTGVDEAEAVQIENSFRPEEG